MSVERCVEYAQLTHEAEGSQTPAPQWPESGKLELSGVSLRYRPHLPLALRQLTIEIPGRAKVALVGRTGSGKVRAPPLYPLPQMSKGKPRLHTDLHAERAELPLPPRGGLDPAGRR